MATRTFTISKDAHVIESPDAGAGADDHLNVGDFGGYHHRSFLQFNLNFADVVSITAATLHMRTNNAHGSIGSSPSIRIRRLTGSWTEGTVGTSEDFSSSNAVKWSNMPGTTATNEVGPTNPGTADETWVSISILELVRDWFEGSTNYGITLLVNTPGNTTDRIAFYSRESAYDPYISITYTTNVAPTAPTLTSPASGAVVNDTTPLLDWTHNDPDGDAQASYQVEVDDSSAFTSRHWYSGTVNSATSSVTAGSGGTGSALVRGTTYYWRVRTKDPDGLWGPWSSARTVKIASLPVGTVTSPGASTAAPLYYTAGSDTTPKLRVGWTFSCPDGGTQASASIKVYLDPVGPAQHTHAHSGTALTADLSGYTVANGTKYNVAVIVTCSHGAVSAESAVKLCRVRWARASYRADLGAVPVSLAVVPASTPNGGQVILEYQSTAASTPEPTDWNASISAITKRQWIWHRVTLLPAVTAAPSSPSLDSLRFDYSANALVPDFWVLAATGSIDQGTFVYGTQSLKHDGDGTTQRTVQTVAVVENTDYILSGRMKTVGAPNARVELVNPADPAGVFASGYAPSDTEWARYPTSIWNSGGTTSVQIALVSDGPVGSQVFFDAIKLEASRVVTPWTPGFLGAAVTLDAGGVMVDATPGAGGVFRLRSPLGNTVELDEGGLRISGTGDASLAGTAHGFQIGSSDGANLIIDNNEMMARSAGAAATLFLNNDGGDVHLGGGLQIGSGVPSRSGLAPIVRAYGSDTTWTKPAGLAYIIVEVVGGGGGGGGAGTTTSGQSSSGACGGGGGYARKLFAASVLPATCAVDIGAAGAAGAAAAGNGGTGGTTTFSGSGITSVSGVGGSGGAGMAGTSANARATGGNGGGCSGGDLLCYGGDGAGGTVYTGVPTDQGTGGDSYIGGGGAKTNSTPGAGVGYGGGGAGATRAGTNTQMAGAAGNVGRCIVTEHYL